jgi:multiple sugar transport system ATP-binding protein
MRVRFERVSKSFGAQRVLHEIDLEVAQGEFMVLLGPSGCGKTTLLRLLAGLERPEAGRILIGDRAVNEVAPAERDVAMVFQSYALYPHMTVYENVAFPLRSRRRPQAEIARRVREAAERLELGALLERRPAQLSGGQRQRVALARAIVRSPAVYLMDEPLSNLDAQLRVQTRAELKRLHQDLGTTTLYVTHDQGEAMTLGGRIALLRQGSIEQVGRPLDLYSRPANRFVGSFLGSPSLNLLPLAAGPAGPGAAGLPVRLPEWLGDALAGGRGIEVGIRPEDVALHSEPGPGRAPARVVVVEPMGHETLVTLEAAGARLAARGPGGTPLAPGAQVHFAAAPEAILYFDRDSGRRLDPDAREPLPALPRLTAPAG